MRLKSSLCVCPARLIPGRDFNFNRYQMISNAHFGLISGCNWVIMVSGCGNLHTAKLFLSLPNRQNSTAPKIKLRLFICAQSSGQSAANLYSS